jgi:transposase
MSGERRKEIKRHLTKEELDDKRAEAEDDDIIDRIGFLQNLYYGDTIKEAADREGYSESTGDRWAEEWNEGGLEALAPSYGGGRPPKLDQDQQDELLELLRDDQPWKQHEVQHLIEEEFGVEYHPAYLSQLLRSLNLNYSIPRPKRPDRPDNAEEILDERVEAALDAPETDEPHNKREEDDEDEEWARDDDVCTDGGTIVGFFDVSNPQPTDNSHRVWWVDDPHIERPLIEVDDPAVGFYALNGESLVSFSKDQTKESICDILEQIREQNPGKRILLVLDQFGSHICKYTRKRAHRLGIDLVFLPVGSAHLNPIEQVWKSLRRTASPIVVESEAEFRTLVRDIYQELTQKISFAGKWIKDFLDLQKLS